MFADEATACGSTPGLQGPGRPTRGRCQRQPKYLLWGELPEALQCGGEGCLRNSAI